MSKTIEEKINDLEGEISSLTSTISTLTTNSLSYKGVLSGDFDDYTTTGIYYTNSNTPDNSPSTTITYAQVIVINTGGTVHQFVCRSTAVLYARRLSGSPLTWSDWMYFVGTSV